MSKKNLYIYIYYIIKKKLKLGRKYNSRRF